MLRNYFTIAIRHLTRHKLFSIINIFCLAIGITFSMIVSVYLLNQQNVNSNIKNVNSQYLIKSKWKIKELGLDITTLGPLAKTMKDEYPRLVANYYRFNPVTNVVSAGDKYFKEDIAIGDTTLISMFGFQLLYGNREQAFPGNNAAVITETLAMKLFGRKDVINQTISIQTTVNAERQDYVVSGVLKDIPYNSVTNLIGDSYNVYVPAAGSRYYQKAGGDLFGNWNDRYEVGLIELKAGVSPQALEQPFKQILQKYTTSNIKDNLEIELASIKDYYIRANNGTVQKMITTLSSIAGFILLMAIINFININIGTSSYRLKEIGLRKVFGSARLQLMIQFIIEALVLTFIAAMVSVVLYEMLRPAFNQVLNTDLSSLWQFGYDKISLLLLLVIVVGFISGIYPAFVLSSSNVINSVKGKIDAARGGLWLRKSLLLVQFTLAIIVFVSALNVSRQVSFVFKKDLGYNKEQLLVVTAFPKQWDSVGVLKMESIKQGLLQLPVVRDASLTFEIPERTPPNASDLVAEGANEAQPLNIHSIDADENYASTFGLHLQQGTFFNHEPGAYKPHEIVLNEAALKAFGWKDAIGKKIKWVSGGITFTVTGVVKDFNYSSLHHAIDPLVFMHVKDARTYRYLTVKLNTTDMAYAIEEVKREWKKLSPKAPFEYFFMDEKFESLYKSELQLNKAAGIATVLTLIIVFMGIFGVVAFTLNKRTKEIAIRKVLGADLPTIIGLFMKDYAWLILIANVIAWPLAYSITGKWLENYAYKTPQDIFLYLFAGLFLFVTAFILIAAQCFKTASSNPVESLRTE